MWVGRSASSAFPGYCVLLCACLFAFPLLPASSSASNDLRWSSAIPSDSRGLLLTDDGTLLLMTRAALMGFDPATGKELWRRTDFEDLGRRTLECRGF